jgi:hypothetical protein
MANFTLDRRRSWRRLAAAFRSGACFRAGAGGLRTEGGGPEAPGATASVSRSPRIERDVRHEIHGQLRTRSAVLVAGAAYARGGLRAAASATTPATRGRGELW